VAKGDKAPFTALVAPDACVDRGHGFMKTSDLTDRAGSSS
jgi:hypothetical protein